MRRPASRRSALPAADGVLDLFHSAAAGQALTPAVPAGAVSPAFAAPALRIPGATAETAVPVAALTQTARDVVEGALPPLWVRGEVSDFKRHRNGHWYFCLRDDAAQVRCVVWERDQRDRRSLPAAPDDGMSVAAFGQLTVYPARGELHLTVRRMEARGDGLWRKALEETRSRLERDGLLAPARRRPLPACPACVAVVTSPDGAAVRDIIAVVRRRAPHVAVVVSPAAVQGAGAPGELCAALERVGRWGGADVIIMGRGGGSREDLWAFNDERVARAIAAAPVPVVSAVGHEIDVTIADLVADFRAPTPSAAAEAAVPVRAALLDELAAARGRLVAAARWRLAAEADGLARTRTRLHDAAALGMERRRAAVGVLAGRLEALSPLATLARGYAVARELATGRTIASAAGVPETAAFLLRFHDGEVGVRRAGRPAAGSEPGA